VKFNLMREGKERGNQERKLIWGVKETKKKASNRAKGEGGHEPRGKQKNMSSHIEKRMKNTYI